MSRVTVVIKTNEGGIWLLPQVKELRSRGCTVTVVLPPGEGRLRRDLNSVGCPVVESPFDFDFRPPVRLVRGLLALRRVLRSTAPDTIFYHLYASALACRVASLGLGARRVHMVAGPLYLESRVIRFVERFACRLDHHLIAGSKFTEGAYRRLGMPTSRLSCVPYGVDTQRFSPGEDAREVSLGVGPETFVVIMVAYVYAPKNSVFPGVGVKGHEVLLDAWRIFTQVHGSSLLVLVGSGFDAAGEEHRRKLMIDHEVGSNKTIRWIDSIADVRTIYRSADLSVSPSLSENHGAALEASSIGLPSIVSDAGGLPEAISVESGWVVPAGNVAALATALSAAWSEFENGSLVSRGGAARSMMTASFSVDSCADSVANVVLGGTSR